jgi:hypothetical protein
MQEVKNLAQAMREAVASIKDEAKKAVDEFQAEVVNSKVNMQKVKAFTDDLKKANKEVEAIIGGGSNFGAPVDKNGVTVNKDK